jgi:condensin complex subunit 2
MDTTANKTRREKKEPFKIDFLTPATKPQKEIIKEIFAPVTKGGSITLPYFSKAGKKGGRGRKGKDKREKRSEQTLPDDMHFSSRQLVTLFLKPKFAVSSLPGYMSIGLADSSSSAAYDVNDRCCDLHHVRNA